MKLSSLVCVAAACGAFAAAASADVTVTRGSGAPTYTSTLNFDEVGGPTGTNIPSNAWAASGVLSLISGDGVANSVGDQSTAFGVPGLGTGNAYHGPWGIVLQLAQDATAMSFQYWDDSGPASPFGGGATVVILNDGVEIGSLFHSPVFGGNTNSWFNVTTSGASTFDEVRMFGFGFFPQAVTDNISWNSVPAPGALTLLGLGGAATLRRRRR